MQEERPRARRHTHTGRSYFLYQRVHGGRPGEAADGYRGVHCFAHATRLNHYRRHTNGDGVRGMLFSVLCGIYLYVCLSSSLFDSFYSFQIPDTINSISLVHAGHYDGAMAGAIGSQVRTIWILSYLYHMLILNSSIHIGY